MLNRIMAWLRPRCTIRNPVRAAMRRAGILTGSDTQLLIRALGNESGHVERLTGEIERIDRKVNSLFKVLEEMIEAAGLNESGASNDAPAESDGRLSLIKRIEELEWRADAQDEAWTAWREVQQSGRKTAESTPHFSSGAGS